MLAMQLRRSHFLFLGYSMRDWNLRVILHRIWGEQRLKYKSWAIQRDPDKLEREFWGLRGVDVHDVPLEEYVEGLRGTSTLCRPRPAQPRSCQPGHERARHALPATQTGRFSPYKGLVHYEEQDGPFFFGREVDCDLVVANLLAARLTLLYGQSGVGKSSLLHAGVMSRMDALARESAARRHSPDVVAVSFAGWRDNPLLGLSDAIGRQLVTYHGTVAADFPRTAPVSAELLMEWTERLDIDMVLILDQFEEFFLYHEAEDVAEGFAGEWSRALRMPGLRVNFLVAIREDALARMDRFEGFVPGLFDNYLRLEHLTADGAKQAIERPVKRYNSLVSAGATVRVEPALVTELIDQTRSGRVSVVQTGEGGVDREDAGERDRIETPYLQLVLTRLWAEEMAAGSQELRADTLDRFGGAQHIVRTHLDEVMAQLPPNRQQIAARVFRQLVTPSGTKIAYTCGDLAAYTGVDERELGFLADRDHDDLHTANILVNGEKYRFIDAAETCLGHPFCTLFVSLRVANYVLKYDEAAMELLRQAYLKPWLAFAPMKRLERAFALAQRLGSLYKALNWYRLVTWLPADQRWSRRTRCPTTYGEFFWERRIDTPHG